MCGAAGASACGNTPSGNKPGSKSAAARSTVEPARPAAGQPEVVPVAVREPAKPAETLSDSAPAPTAAHSLVLGEGRGGFRLNALTLSDDAKAKIDEMFAAAKEELINARFLIEGYTDNLGQKDVNERIGLARAIAVKQYLGSEYGIQPSRIKVVSYGSENPIGDNTTQEGRALNRRVVIKVLD
jgi:outer membrane protein OmpA-like peptidoglycan-associated protein